MNRGYTVSKTWEWRGGRGIFHGECKEIKNIAAEPPCSTTSMLIECMHWHECMDKYMNKWITMRDRFSMTKGEKVKESLSSFFIFFP